MITKLVGTVVTAFTVLISVFWSTLTPSSPVGYYQKTWNAGTIKVLSYNIFYGKAGQGYLFTDGQRVYLRTIYHVIQHVLASFPMMLPKIQVSFPSVPELGWIELDPGLFQCGKLNQYFDTWCYTPIDPQLSKLILAGKLPLMPYILAANIPELEVGTLVASPRPDTGKWTYYQVVQISDDEVLIAAHPLDRNRDGVFESLEGNICKGRSGSPVVIVQEVNGQRQFVTWQGFALSIGEVERGVEVTALPDYLDPKVTCFLQMRIKRP